MGTPTYKLIADLIGDEDLPEPQKGRLIAALAEAYDPVLDRAEYVHYKPMGSILLSWWHREYAASVNVVYGNPCNIIVDFQVNAVDPLDAYLFQWEEPMDSQTWFDVVADLKEALEEP